MAFLGSIGKFVGGVVGQVAKAAPAIVTGFATGGASGAGKGLLASLATQQGGQNPLFGGLQQAGTYQTSYGGAYGIPQDYGNPNPTGPAPVPVSTGQQVALTQDIFNIIVKLAQQLGVPIRTAGAVVRIGRNLIAKLLRFARANPGLTIVNLLLNLGLAADEATRLIAWYSTYGKRRRRIKVTNVKALNRSVRRLEGFRRLSHRVEAALTRRGAGRTITRSRRCPRCRKSPCCC